MPNVAIRKSIYNILEGEARRRKTSMSEIISIAINDWLVATIEKERKAAIKDPDEALVEEARNASTPQGMAAVKRSAMIRRNLCIAANRLCNDMCPKWDVCGRYLDD